MANFNIENIITQVCSSSNHHAELRIKEVLSKLLCNIDNYHNDNPTLIGLGGLPGVGKSTYSTKYYKERFFIINPDEYRQYHPNYSRLNSFNLINTTNKFSSHICELLFEILTILSCNILMECSFSNYNYWQYFLQSHHMYLNKYYKKLIILSASLETCYQSMCYRQKIEIQNMECLIPRPVNKTFLLDKANSMEDSIKKFLHNNIFDEIIFLHKHSLFSNFEQITYNDYLSAINTMQ